MKKNRTYLSVTSAVCVAALWAALSLVGCVGVPQGNRISRLERETATENEAAKSTVEKLIKALDDRDAASVREMFSPYALENSPDLDEKIREMFEYYPGMDEEYECINPSSRSSDYGTVVHIINPVIFAESGGERYDIIICRYLRNDEDPSMEGVHLVEIIKEKDKPEGFKRMNEDDMPGVYVGE